ncbi:MAG: sulfotransferase domain-containing protein, partial [Bradyrhizobium sp.]
MLNCFSRRRSEGAAEQFSFVAVGYPKVGNTWLRVTLGRYTQRLAGLPELPLFELGDSQRLSKAVGPAGAGYFTHAPLEWTAQTASELNRANVVRPFREQKVILLVRHPLDAVVSHYMHNSHKVEDGSRFTGSLDDFVEDQVLGLDKLLKFYEVWREGLGDVRAYLLWRYEDARRDPLNNLQQIVRFLDLPMDQAAAKDAVDFSSFENM